jgi:hypothetical protein
MLLQIPASNIHSGSVVTTPGSTSTWITRPQARCSLYCTRSRRP